MLVITRYFRLQHISVNYYQLVIIFYCWNLISYVYIQDIIIYHINYVTLSRCLPFVLTWIANHCDKVVLFVTWSECSSFVEVAEVGRENFVILSLRWYTFRHTVLVFWHYFFQRTAFSNSRQLWIFFKTPRIVLSILNQINCLVSSLENKYNLNNSKFPARFCRFIFQIKLSYFKFKK